MRKTLTFDELWKMAETAARSCNGLTYHHCCDVWTSRSAKVSRDSHKQKLHWKNLLSTLNKQAEDKKQALLAKMTEEGWRLPAVLNETCQAQPRQLFGPQALSNHFSESVQPASLQPGLADYLFLLPGQTSSQVVTPSGTLTLI